MKKLIEGQELGDFVLISKTDYQKWLRVKKQRSDAGKKRWLNVSVKERTKIAKKLGKAGSKKRWGK